MLLLFGDSYQMGACLQLWTYDNLDAVAKSDEISAKFVNSHVFEFNRAKLGHSLWRAPHAVGKLLVPPNPVHARYEKSG